MKIARFLSVPLLGLFLATTWAGADPAYTDPADDPNMQYDADGVPLAVTQHQPKRLSPAELDTLHKQQEQAELNKNWLVRNYEHQLQVRASANSLIDPDANLYYRLSSNKDLAKLAGLPSLDSDDQDSATSYRTGAAPSAPGSVTLRPTTSSAAAGGSSPRKTFFKPLITPLSAPDVAGLHDFYSSLPVAMPSPFSGVLPPATPTPPAPRTDQAPDSSDIETPGMIAAEKDPLANPGATDLSLDVLPGETVEQARARQEENNKLDLPLPMDAAQLHKDQAASLTVAGVPTLPSATPPVAAPVKTAPTEDPEAPMPVNKALQINPVRSPIANPYDILDR